MCKDNFIRKKTVFKKGKQEQLINVGYGIDDNYCRPMAASIASLCKHNPERNFTFHVMTAGLHKENILKLRQLAEELSTNIVVYALDVSLLKDLPTQAHLPLPTYFRFLLPLILDKAERLYYIDADIVCLHALADLWDRDFQGNIIMAVKDLPWMRKKREAALKIAPDSYFNAGMLVINLPAWNEFKVFDKVLEAIRENPQLFRYLDQDGLNLVLNGRVLYLPGIFNCLDISQTELSEVGLLHFAAHPKPWHLSYAISRVGEVLDQRLYLDCEELTPWGGAALEAPKNSKEYRMYAKALWKQKRYLESLSNYYRYFRSK